VLRPHSTKLGQIMDISRGRLAFRYIASEEPSNGSFKLVRFAHNWNIGMVGTQVKLCAMLGLRGFSSFLYIVPIFHCSSIKFAIASINIYHLNRF